MLTPLLCGHFRFYTKSRAIEFPLLSIFNFAWTSPDLSFRRSQLPKLSISLAVGGLCLESLIRLANDSALGKEKRKLFGWPMKHKQSGKACALSPRWMFAKRVGSLLRLFLFEFMSSVCGRRHWAVSYFCVPLRRVMCSQIVDPLFYCSFFRLCYCVWD